MLSIVVAMVLILVVAGLVLTYAAYPHRGHHVPGATWLGTAMTRTVERAPVLPQEQGSRAEPQLEQGIEREHLLHR